MIKDGYFIDTNGERYKIYIDSYGYRYIEKKRKEFSSIKSDLITPQNTKKEN